MKNQWANLKWFDLEITDGQINEKIKETAVKIFEFWKTVEVRSVGSQKLSQWRPQNCIALVTNQKDFESLSELVNEAQRIKEFSNKKYVFRLLYENNNVLRYICMEN